MERFSIATRGDRITVTGLPGWAGYRIRARLQEVDGSPQVVDYSVERIDPDARLPQTVPPFALITRFLRGIEVPGYFRRPDESKPAATRLTTDTERAAWKVQAEDAELQHLALLQRLSTGVPIPYRRGELEFYRQVLDVAEAAKQSGKPQRQAVQEFYGWSPNSTSRAKQVIQEARRALAEPATGRGVPRDTPTTASASDSLAQQRAASRRVVRPTTEESK